MYRMRGNMVYQINRALATAGLGCVLLVSAACPHKAASGSVPTADSASSAQLASMKPDQVNTAGWDMAWTNLVNDVAQTFTPSLTRLTGVEVELVVGNAGPAKDQVTLTVLDATGQTIAVMTESVPTADCDQVMFVIPKGGVKVTPGQTYRLKLNDGTTFGWKYVVGGYERGEATFNGKPLLREARSTFLFRTFGPK
jgi:hypothetical protein